MKKEKAVLNMEDMLSQDIQGMDDKVLITLIGDKSNVLELCLTPRNLSGINYNETSLEIYMKDGYAYVLNFGKNNASIYKSFSEKLKAKCLEIDWSDEEI